MAKGFGADNKVGRVDVDLNWLKLRVMDFERDFDELAERVESLSGAIDNLTIGIVGDNFHFRVQYNYDHIKALEERVDELSDAVIGLAEGVMATEDIMMDIRFVLCGYSEGENCCAEVV